MNGESVLLKWDPPENHAVVTNYTILYREANVKDQFKQVQCAPKFLIFSSHKCLPWKIMSDYGLHIFIIPPANEVAGVYSDPYVRPFVRSFVRPSVRLSVRPSQSLISYSSKTAEQNFMKLSGIVHYMMPYCTSYFKFLSTWLWGFPEQNKDFAITTYGRGGPSLIHYSSKTAEQNFMKLSGIVHYMMPYCTSYFKF